MTASDAVEPGLLIGARCRSDVLTGVRAKYRSEACQNMRSHASDLYSANRLKAEPQLGSCAASKRRRKDWLFLVNVRGNTGQLAPVVSTSCSKATAKQQERFCRSLLPEQASLCQRKRLFSQQTSVFCASCCICTVVQWTCYFRNFGQSLVPSDF